LKLKLCERQVWSIIDEADILGKCLPFIPGVQRLTLLEIKL
jgi:hypothetical protein